MQLASQQNCKTSWKKNPPITAFECDLLTPLNQTTLFSMRCAELIDGSERRQQTKFFIIQLFNDIKSSGNI